MLTRFITLCIGAILLAGATGPLFAAGRLELIVVDKQTGRPVPCRLHLVGPQKKAFKPEKLPFWHDHFVFPGKITLRLPLGNYSFTLERGPEYLNRDGSFTIKNFADDSKRIELRRFIDMSADGWWSGDLDVRRPFGDIELLMAADDLHVAELVTWRNGQPPAGLLHEPAVARFDGDRYCDCLAGLWARPGSQLLLFQLPAPPKLPAAQAEFPPTTDLLLEARGKSDFWVDLSRPFWWDLPMLIAAGQVDSIELAGGDLCRDLVLADNSGGRPRDPDRDRGAAGLGEYCQQIYFRLLECGLRIPPTAGSGSGESLNPVGYNRVYAHVDGELSYAKWWQSVRAGQVVVTNGPLLKPSADGELPGHVFEADEGAKLEIQPALTVSTREPISYLEIVKDGRIEKALRFEDYAKTGKLPPIVFDRSGWFLIRAVCDQPRPTASP